MSQPTLDVVVIGAGPAGLAASSHLQQHGLRHIVFERERIGETWRTQRWDSFRLNSPNRFNVLPGDTYEGTRPVGFDSAREFVSYLEGYVQRFRLPVEEHAHVVSVDRNSASYHVAVGGKGTIRTLACRNVIVASGAMNRPLTPSFAREFSSDVKQIHAGEYRNPSGLPDGAVLVVGGAQSGLQVAEDILDAGRKVFLSTSAVARVPRRYRGKDILEWLLQVGFYDMKAMDITDHKILQMRQPQVSGVGLLGHTVSLQDLAKRGAIVLGRIDGARGKLAHFRGDASDNIRFGDDFSGRIKAMIEKFIDENNLDAPPPERDPADEPDPEASCASSITMLDLERENIRSIVWATGFTGDFSYLHGHPLDEIGRPLHLNGVSPQSGISFVGFPWLRKRKSTIIHGIAEDAEFITEHVMNA